jgi:hypothetical protein
MNKKIITALAAITLLAPTSAHAALKNSTAVQKPTIAILDTAIDTSISSLQGRVAYEVCILEWNSCPNGQKFMEGPGSAKLSANVITKNGFDHGTMMASTFASNNSTYDIVFVRIIGVSVNGIRQIANEATFVNALDWVYKNKERLNIQAVSMSQSNHNLMPGANYCPNTPSTQSKINGLVSSGIPVFLAAGNMRDIKRISWPACLDQSIAVGAATDYDEIPIWSNVDMNKSDLYDLGFADIVTVGNKTVSISGTSVSTQIAAAHWLTIKDSKPTLSYQQLYDLILKTSTPIIGPKNVSGKMINLNGAINVR